MIQQPLRVAIAGLGTVGVGALRILTEQMDIIAPRAGRQIQLVAAADLAKPAGVDLSNVKWYDDAVDMAANSDADVICELIGGYGEDGPAKRTVDAAIAAGKHVVTANKALLALYGPSLASAADANNCSLGFEAAVCGGIPVIKGIREGLAANRVHKVQGIMNGTCNYILTTMRVEGRSFDDVLAEAQAKGYAETPPDLDVDGIDTAHKLTLLGATAFGCTPDFAATYCEGIRDVSIGDIEAASELGYRIKLLGVCEKTPNGISQRVHPALVSTDKLIANVEDVFNAVQVDGDFIGSAFFQGPGAGMEATASAVIADVIDFARGNRVETFGVPVANLTNETYLDIDQHSCSYFIRSDAANLGSITDALGQASIGVQSSQTVGDHAVAITDIANESDVQKAVNGNGWSVIRVES